MKSFARRGADVNNPRFGAWVEGGGGGRHQSWSRAYSDNWEEWLDRNPETTPADIENFYNFIRTDERRNGGF